MFKFIYNFMQKFLKTTFNMQTTAIKKTSPLGFTWSTNDPFIFCVHHADDYPEGNKDLGPAASLEGRYIGSDFTLKDGWRMYHGDSVPGFPAHPHRGFETVTIVLEGYVDHSDSMGASGRYGFGDVQWMTAGSGMQHCEMFPLVHQNKRNPLELFQLWLNLPRNKKFSTPFYKMLWNEQIPIIEQADPNGKKTKIRVIAGNFGNAKAVPPPPDSWAANPENHLAIWLFEMEEGASFQLPAAERNLERSLYFYSGQEAKIDGTKVKGYNSIGLESHIGITIEATNGNCKFLLLQAKPINEPVVQHGPFVMNSPQEINEAIHDFRKTGFGGWPWPSNDHTHGNSEKRFAKYADGTEDLPNF